MRGTANQNLRVQKPVYHLSLAADPGDRLSRQQWDQVVGRVLKDLGLHEHQALVVAHRDTAHPHVHVMVNRVHPENLRVWDNSHDWRRIEKSLRRLERDLGLREVPGHHGRLPGQEPPDRTTGRRPGEVQEERRTGQEAFQERARRELRQPFQESSSWAELEGRLREHGVWLEKRGRGLVVTDGDRSIQASRILRSGSIHRLEARFGVPFSEYQTKVDRVREALSTLERTEARRKDLAAAESRFGGEAQRAKGYLDAHEYLRVQESRARAILKVQMDGVYRPGEAGPALARFKAHTREVGWERAGERLRISPQDYGPLRGRHLGLVETRERREARSTARLAAGTASRLGGLIRQIAAQEPAVREALRVYRVAERAFQTARLALRALTPTHTLQHQLARAGLALGLKAVGLALPAPAARVVTLAVAALEKSVELARGGRERERER
jgi:hypothetical protein